MTKETILKVLTPGCSLSASDMTPQEKQSLYDMMVAEGATQSFAYDRFFKEGFQQWEIEGTDSLKRQYVAEMERDGADCGHFTSMSDDDQMCHGHFWRFLGIIRHRTRFAQFMADRGMKSAVTVAKRFGSDDWKPFERRGIRAVLTEFVESEKQG